MLWTVRLEGGPRRVNHAAVTVNDTIYSFGGYCTGENYRSRRPIDVHALNTTTYRWFTVGLKYSDLWEIHVPYQRYGHTAVAFGDKIYLWGGRNDLAACNVLYCFDTATMEWTAPKVSGVIPGARDGHSACVIGHHMYTFGGFEEIIERFSQDVHALDLHTMKWTYIITRGNPPSFRDFHSATALCENRMYIFGGRGDEMGPFHSQRDVYSNEIAYLDTSTNMWHWPETKNNIPHGRRSHSAFVYREYLYIFGGFNALLNLHFNDIYRFSPITNDWEEVKTHGKSPCERRRQSCIVIGDRAFLFGGTSPQPGVSSDPDNEEHDGGILMDHTDLHVLDFSPNLKTLCLMVVLKHNLNTFWLPECLRDEIRAMTTNNLISRPINNNG